MYALCSLQLVGPIVLLGLACFSGRLIELTGYSCKQLCLSEFSRFVMTITDVWDDHDKCVMIIYNLCYVWYQLHAILDSQAKFEQTLAFPPTSTCAIKCKCLMVLCCTHTGHTSDLVSTHIFNYHTSCCEKHLYDMLKYSIIFHVIASWPA